jgi:uncharacterized glyoxalase superfamily protein PhnB
MDDPVRVKQLIPTFHVRDVEKAAAWYRDVMGFEVRFVDPPHYAGVATCGLVLHLARWEKAGEPPPSQAYVLLEEGVDEYHARLVERGAVFHQAPKDQFYGLRECNLRDLDGNYLHVGQAIPE